MNPLAPERLDGVESHLALNCAVNRLRDAAQRAHQLGEAGRPKLLRTVGKRLLRLRMNLDHEAAFIHDADSDMAKLNLFKAVNDGRVRILIGSTEKMGAGPT